jgi:hypothetical protein
MLEYLGCLKMNANDNGKCRLLSKRYLECRMDKYVARTIDFFYAFYPLHSTEADLSCCSPLIVI